MKVWKMIFLLKQVIFRFNVNFPGCKAKKMLICQLFVELFENMLRFLLRDVEC